MSVITVQGQTDAHEPELKHIWNNCIVPIINNDVHALKELVHFPLLGDWGYLMELDKPDSLWTKQDFFDNLDNLFNKSFVDGLKSGSYRDLIKYSPDEIRTQIHLSHHWISNEGFEKGIILRFEQVESLWKLVTIQAVG